MIASIQLMITPEQAAKLKQSRLFTDRCSHQCLRPVEPLIVATHTGCHSLVLGKTQRGYIFQFLRQSGSKDYQFTLEVLETLQSVLRTPCCWVELHSWKKHIFLANCASLAQGLLTLQRQKYREKRGEAPTLTIEEAEATASLLTTALFAEKRQQRQLRSQWLQQASRYAVRSSDGQ